MNQQETTGALASGGRYRATGYLVELTDADGNTVETIDANEIASVQRAGQRVTLKRKKGKDIAIETASLDDAGRLEMALRPAGATAQPVVVKQGGGFRRFALIGCGGLLALIVVVIIIAAATSGGGGDESAGTSSSGGTTAGRASEASLSAGQSATAENLKLTVVEVRDPYVPSNQFSRPSAGNRFVAYKVQFENVGNRNQSVNAFNFKLVDAENFQHNFASVVFDEQSLVGQAQQLGGGTKVEGWIGFEVKEGVAVKELTYDPNPVTRDDHRFRAP